MNQVFFSIFYPCFIFEVLNHKFEYFYLLGFRYKKDFFGHFSFFGKSEYSPLTSLQSDEGFKVEIASDGESAIRIMQQIDFDAVISECKMPGKSGFELYLYCLDYQIRKAYLLVKE